MDYLYRYDRKHSYVYALVDPRDGSPRYIGYTDANPQFRLGRHYGETWGEDSKKEVNLKQRWIRGLESVGTGVGVVTIFEGASAEARDIESALINKYWNWITNGGVGKDDTNIDGTIRKKALRVFRSRFPNMKTYKTLRKSYPGLIID